MPVAAGLLTFFFHPTVGRMERVVDVFDAFGLALFCVTGALKAVEYGLGPVPAALMGMVTGIGGGMVRDVLAAGCRWSSAASCTRTPALAGAGGGRRCWTGCAVAGSRRARRGRPLPGLAAARDGRDWRAPLPPGPASV